MVVCTNSKILFIFFFSSRRRHTRLQGDWSSDVCSSDLDALFANAPKAGPELRTYAQQVGLDLPSFERCLASGTHAATVQKSVDEAIRLGVTGTPAFFVNGELLSGAQPLEELTRVIERELARGR